MLKNISLILVLVVSHINIYLVASYSGYFMGYNNGNIAAENHCDKWCESYRVINGEFSYKLSGYIATEFQALYAIHLISGFFLLFLLVGVFIRNSRVSKILSGISLVFVLAVFVFSTFSKYYLFNKPDFLDEEKFGHLYILKDFIVVDQICIGLLLSLFIIQIYMLFHSHRLPKQPIAN